MRGTPSTDRQGPSTACLWDDPGPLGPFAELHFQHGFGKLGCVKSRKQTAGGRRASDLSPVDRIVKEGGWDHMVAAAFFALAPGTLSFLL